jgi:hypothetical protein
VRIHSADPSRYLLEPSNLDRDALPDFLRAYREPLKNVLSWSREFLSNPHPDLGREGAVCPYTQPSLERNLFWMTVYPGAHPTMDEVRTVVMAYCEWFLELVPLTGRDAQYKTILILFPDLAPDLAPGIIDIIQATLKPEFIPKGLMIGQFHAVCEEPGLRNPHFRPLRTTVPLLAIRHMVPTDFPFLAKKPEWIAAYLQTFGGNLPKRVRREVAEIAHAYGLAIPEPQPQPQHALK